MVPRTPEGWRTVRYAMGDWGRTARFCCIAMSLSTLVMASTIGSYLIIHRLI